VEAPAQPIFDDANDNDSSSKSGEVQQHAEADRQEVDPPSSR